VLARAERAVGDRADRAAARERIAIDEIAAEADFRAFRGAQVQLSGIHQSHAHVRSGIVSHRRRSPTAPAAASGVASRRCQIRKFRGRSRSRGTTSFALCF
jgi:hypothetical protein